LRRVPGQSLSSEHVVVQSDPVGGVGRLAVGEETGSKHIPVEQRELRL
jgi:hypothetical protein